MRATKNGRRIVYLSGDLKRFRMTSKNKNNNNNHGSGEAGRLGREKKTDRPEMELGTLTKK